MKLGPLAMALALVGLGCERSTSITSPGDAARSDSRADSGAETETGTETGAPDADGDGTTAADSGPVEGPLTFIIYDIEMLSDRICDLDGDGLADNSVADLGSPHSEIFRLMVNAMIDDTFGTDDGYQYLLHAPMVADLSGPTDDDLCMFPVVGIDMDSPYDGSDNLSGREPFWRGDAYVDDCGEPTFASSDLTLDGGRLSGTVSVLPVAFVTDIFLIEDAQGDGVIDLDEGSLDMQICGVATFESLGSIAGMPQAGDLTLLELLLVGGAAFGTPTAPGLEPDLDLDGDGLERFVLDDGGHITTCIDGDESAIEGRDCWRDGRMADGLSMNLEIYGVTAVLGDFHPEIDAFIDETCPDRPAETAWNGC